MIINNKKFKDVRLLFASMKNEVEIIPEKLINGAPDDIGLETFEKFIKASGLIDNLENTIFICEIYTGKDLNTLQNLCCYEILKTGAFYFAQLKKFVTLLAEINKKYEVPSKYSVTLQDEYGWFGVIKMLSGGDITKHNAILKIPLYDVIAAVKSILDENYSNYIKLKRNE